MVLSYPEFSEPLKLIQHFQEQQKAWLEEKDALLALVKSWENLVLKIKEDDKDKVPDTRRVVQKHSFKCETTLFTVLLWPIRFVFGFSNLSFVTRKSLFLDLCMIAVPLKDFFQIQSIVNS